MREKSLGFTRPIADVLVGLAACCHCVCAALLLLLLLLLLARN